MTTEDYYQQYLNRDIFEVFDITCEFFSKELSKDVIDNYDVGEVILETVGHHIDDKKFPQVFQFVELLREKQPSLYQEYFQYMDDFLVDYNCFIGDKNGVVNAFQNFIENPVHEFDQFLQAFKMLRFYQYSGLVEQAVSQSYEEVRDAEDLMGNAAQYLAICQFYIALEERFDRKSGFIDIESFLSSLSEYDFDFDYSFLNSIGNGLRKDSLDAEALEKLFERNYRGALMEIEGCFLRFMSEKGFKFFLSGFFWDEMLKYWYRDDVSGQTLTTLFDLDGSSFEEFIVGYHSWIFGDNKHEMAAVLWGSVYVYEFLFRNGLISKEAFDDFFVIASRLKGKMIGLFVSGLWRFDFVHTWEKPECISEVEFEAERSIFRKSYSFPVGDFASIKEEMAEEFLLLPDLGSYILEGIDLEANEQNSAGDFLFENNDFVHDFFSPQEPLRVEKTPGRNDPCLCGSGKKYKKCCGK